MFQPEKPDATVFSLMAKTKTNKGLKVTVDILTGVYETGKKCAADFSKNTHISLDEYLPLWNYQAMGAK
jgi:hypothetical protein